MKGLLFDTERLKRGLPVRWRTEYGGNRYGLITAVTDKSITILAILDVCEKIFDEMEYGIEEIIEFELLGEWKKEDE